MSENYLYYGDNLQVLREHVQAESVDLVYLDPPFNSNANYNVLFAEQDGKKAAAQIQAFEDTWRWDQAAAEAFLEITEAGGKVSEAMQAFYLILGHSNMLAYLAMMAPRLVELKRVLKPTGSIYLHCDPTASHYLKLLMDAVFGPTFFRNEIIWKRTSSHGNVSVGYGDVTDSILYYSRGPKPSWNQLYVPYSQKHVEGKFTYAEPDGRRFTTSDMRNPGVRPNLTYEYKGYKPHPNGWAVSREKMEQLDREGRLWFPSNKDGRIRLKRYLDEAPGQKLQSLWDDIPPLNSQAQERLGYPTQKPEALLERIIRASSNEGDVVLDPFCGCGTAIATAHRLKRRWIGIDITYLAISLMKHRLESAFGEDVVYDFKVIGEPTTVQDAEALAAVEDKYPFQWWALGLVGARPDEKKKGADKGIDGRIYFHDDASGKTKQVVISVKAGKLTAGYIRDLHGVVDREHAEIGVLISMQEPTHPMRVEATSAGFYYSPIWNENYPRLQLLTVAELLAGKKLAMPPRAQVDATFKKAPKAKAEKAANIALPLK